MKNNYFYIKDCTLAVVASGIKAQTLSELRDRLTSVPASSIYYHFWGGRLRTEFEYVAYHNDFSHWSYACLHDYVLAERLELIDPTEFLDMEEVRAELIGIVDNRLEEREIIPWSKAEDQFHFVRSKIIVFSTQYKVKQPSELASVVPLLTKSSIFYHVIDAARRVPEARNDFCAWLEGFGEQYAPLIRELRNIDPYFISSADLQAKLTNIIVEYFAK